MRKSVAICRNMSYNRPSEKAKNNIYTGENI